MAGCELEGVGARLDSAHDGARFRRRQRLEPLGVGLVAERAPEQVECDAQHGGRGGLRAEVECRAQLFDVGALGALRVGGAVGADLPLDAVQPAALLEDMRQLVRDEPPSLLDAGAVLARAEDDVTAYGEGPRVGLARERGCLGAGVCAHVGEAAAETRFEEGAQGLGQGLAAAVAQELEAGFELRRDVGPARTLGPLLHPLFFLIGTTPK